MRWLLGGLLGLLLLLQYRLWFAEGGLAEANRLSVRGTHGGSEPSTDHTAPTAAAYRGNSVSTGPASGPAQPIRGVHRDTPSRAMTRAMDEVSAWRTWCASRGPAPRDGSRTAIARRSRRARRRRCMDAAMVPAESPR